MSSPNFSCVLHRKSLYSTANKRSSFGVSQASKHMPSGILLCHKIEMMPFAATWMDLEIGILSEVSQRKTNIYYSYVESNFLQNDTNELI